MDKHTIAHLKTVMDKEQLIDFLADQLEKAELELIKPLPIGELVQRLEGQTYEKWFSESDVKDLKGEQVPVEYQYRYHNHGTGCGEWCRVLTKERYEELQREHAGDNDFVFRMLFTAPQKPINIDASVIRDANRYRFLRDEDSWGEDSDSWDWETKTGLISWENLCDVRLDDFDAAIDARMAASDIPPFNVIKSGFTVEGEPAPVKYIVILQRAWCNDSGSGINYHSDLIEFDKRDKAIKHGFELQDSDDFNIGVLTNGVLTSFDWMAKPLAENKDSLARIASGIGIEGNADAE